MTGSRTETILSRMPDVLYWLELGLQPATARELVKAGYLTEADLAGKTREEVLAIPHFGLGALAIVEGRRGAPFPSRKSELEERGISQRPLQILGRAGIHSLAQLGRLTREQFVNMQGLSRHALRRCERALGHELASPVAEFRRRGMWPPAAYKLSRAGVRTVGELAGRGDAELRALGLRTEDIELCRKWIEEERQRVSPADARFRLLQGGSAGSERAEVLRRIRERWGEAAVEEVRPRVETGTDQEAEAWLRRSAYYLDLPSMLDLDRALPVTVLRIQDLLNLLTEAERPALVLILLTCAAPEPQDRHGAEQAVPWLKDIPDSARATQLLARQGWLLIAAGRKQGLALWKCVRRRRGIRADRFELHAVGK